jgi:hypothetical protein
MRIIDGKVDGIVNWLSESFDKRSVKNFSRAAGGNLILLPVLRGFSRSVKQDSEANKVSGGVSAANVASSAEENWNGKKLFTAETFFMRNLFRGAAIHSPR